MNIVALRLKLKNDRRLARAGHRNWSAAVATSSAIRAKLKRTGPTDGAVWGVGERAQLESQLRDSINHSRELHGKWAARVKQVQADAKAIQAWEAAHQKNATTTTLDLAKAVAAFEGGQSSDGLFHAYWDSAGGVWTIGYGHTVGVTSSSRPLTQAEAETLLLHDLNVTYAPAVARYAKGYGLNLNQKQFDALTSFSYNLGAGYFGVGHSVGDAMKAHNYPGIASAMLLYDKAGGATLPGLTRRRRWESQLFNGGSYAIA
jgi:GH24 family phage-related lysozyme (muramidase)